MPPKKKKSKKLDAGDSPDASAKAPRRRGAQKSNSSGYAQRLTMIIDNLTFDDDCTEKHLRRNVATGIKHLQSMVSDFQRE